MPKLPRFLTTPVWKQVRRGYASFHSPTIKRFFALQSVRRILRITLLTIATYLLLISLGAIGIYQMKTTNFYTQFVETIFPYPAAIVRGESVPLDRFRLEVRARKHYADVQGIAYTDTEIEQFVMEQLVTRTILKQVLAEHAFTISESELNQRMDDIVSQAGGKEKLNQFLKEQYGEQITLDTFRTWMYEAAVETAVQQKVLVHAELKHILVAIPDGGGADGIEKARIKANEIRTSITNPLMFSEVARARSEDVASRDKGGDFGTTNRGNEQPVLSTDFERAAFSTPIGEISEPVLTSYGWHLVYVSSRGGSIDLSQKALLEQVMNEGTIRRFIGQKS